MSNTAQTVKKAEAPLENPISHQADPIVNFDQWAGAVRQQMLAALKKREGVKSAWD